MNPPRAHESAEHPKRAASLRRRVLLLAVSFAVPASALQGYLAWRGFTSVQQAAVREVRAATEAIAAATLSTLRAAENLTGGFASIGPEQLLDPERCRTLVRVTLGLSDSFAGLSVVDANGDLVCSALPTAQPRPSAADREWFQRLKSTGRFTVSEPVMGRITGVRVVVMAAPILGAGGAVVGSVSAGMEIETLARVAGGYLASPGWIATISDQNGMVLARTRDLDEFAGRQLPSLSYPALAEGPGWVVVRGPDLVGNDRFLGRVDLDRYGWRIYAGLPSDELLNAGYREAMDMVLVGLLFLALAMAVAAWAYRAVTNPLDALIADIRSVTSAGSGAISAETEELGTVAAAINHMLAARAAAEERHRDFLANAPFGVFTTTPEGELIEANPALVRMLGYDSVDELRGVGAEALYADPAQRSALVHDVLQRTEFAGAEVVWVRKDGGEIDVWLSGRAIETPGGWRLEGIAEDVTEHRRLEELYRHQQKTEAVSRLAGGVAHEINNSLTVIGGYADVLAMTTQDELVAEDVRMIKEGVRRAAEMTRSLLAISRRDTARPASLDPAEVVREMQALLTRVLPADIELQVWIDADLGRMWMNRGHLVQVLLNLGVNARDAMPDGGRLRIECRAVREQDTEEPRPWVSIAVQDDGSGIPGEVQARIFEPFFTTKPTGVGTGLGLATAAGLVEQAGGRIEVESEPGAGSRFTVLLPTSDRRADDAGQEVAVVAPGGGETILVVEDDTPLRRLVARVLSDAGYDVRQAGRAAEARRALTDLGAPFDLVIADVVLPDGEGPELLAELVPTHAAHGFCMTGYPDRVGSDDLDGRGHLRKPFRIEDLLVRVRQTLDEKR